MNNFIKKATKNHLASILSSIEFCRDDLIILSETMTTALKNGKKILIFGNGGSAADAQHVAAEFINRFKKERIPLPAIALTTDTSIITAISNDYSFNEIFSKQVQALCNSGDIVIGISTSGNSPNVINALQAAKVNGGITVSFIGGKRCKMSDISDITIAAKSADTPRIQEVHIFIFHLLCEMVEKNF
jgi:D-sedoheptulose 7-phosphate isomerase